jgi:pimeloyl-ACP methyl ester carboxylesterase
LRIVKILLLLIALLYAAAVTALWRGQERMLFDPVTLDRAASLTHDADVHERMIDVPGATLSVLELQLPAPKGVVFYLHGNSGNLRTWFVNADFYRQANYDLVMMDYRGFGKSSGHIENEAQLHADVQAVWNEVATRYRGKRIVIYGRSLGTGLAAAFAARVQPDLTVLASPYSSLVALAHEHYPWLPEFVLRYPLRTDETIAGIYRPVLLIHGDRDAFIPPSHSRALQALAPTARLLIVPGAGHSDLQVFESYLRAFRASLDAL